jgi:NTP pyrophosphatase (non-canonical NTP hydrolase)
MESRLTLKALQDYIRQKDFNPDLKLQYLQKLVEEVGELAKAMRQDIRFTQTHQGNPGRRTL